MSCFSVSAIEQLQESTISPSFQKLLYLPHKTKPGNYIVRLTAVLNPFQAPVSVFIIFSVAVIECPVRKQFRGEGVYFGMQV